MLDPWRELSGAVDSIDDLSETARSVVGSVVGAWDRIGDSTAPAAARVDTARSIAVAATRLRHAADTLATYAAGMVEHTATHREDAERSAKSWLVRHCGTSGADANRLRRRAVALERFDEIAAALAAGNITPGHVDAVALIVPSHFHGAQLTDAIEKVAAVQGMLLASAAITTVEEFANFCRRVISRLDTDGVEPPADDGAALTTMIEEQLVRERNRRADADEPADDRPYDERVAAALLELLLRGAGAKQPGRVGLFLHIDVDDHVADAKHAWPDLADLFDHGRAHTEAGLGTTDPRNMAGACVTNHLDDHHAKGWDVQRRPDGAIDVTRPDGTPFDPTPRWQQRATSPPDAA